MCKQKKEKKKKKKTWNCSIGTDILLWMLIQHQIVDQLSSLEKKKRKEEVDLLTFAVVKKKIEKKNT